MPVNVAFPTGTVETRCTGFLSFHVTAISSPLWLNREPLLGKFLTRESLWSVISFGRSFRFGQTVPQAWMPCSLKVNEMRAAAKIVSKQSVAFILKWAREANNSVLCLILLPLPFAASVNFKVPDVSRFGFCQGEQYETKLDGLARKKLSEKLSSFKFDHCFINWNLSG